MEPAPPPKKPRVKKAPRVKREPEEVEAEPGAEGEAAAAGGGPRRSSRLRDAASRPPPETSEQRFERELGEFIVDGSCPKCGRLVERAHRAHLESCAGAKAAAAGYSKADKAALAGLTEEERKDERKRTLARMSALELSGLVEFTLTAATFIVLGSRGDPYTVTLADEKHRCTCLDYRFRRHNCKHICLVLSQVGALDAPATWHAAVEGSLDALARAGAKEAPFPDSVPEDKAAEMATKFL
jgi:hypothetical protein